MTGPRDHGGNLDAAIRTHGGDRADWADLSTGINPVPYPLPALPDGAWTALPDAAARDHLTQAARRFWQVPPEAAVLAVPGASAAIAHLPRLAAPGTVHIPAPTYNEHAAAFGLHGWQVSPDTPLDRDTAPGARVIVHPNNPTGAFHPAPPPGPLTVIDESFCDVAPERSLIHLATRGDTVILKSFGKFWGLAGLRLGFVIGPAALVDSLAEQLGPWPVSGPALAIGTAALSDAPWAQATRTRLARDAAHLDQLMPGARLAGGTTLFRLYEVPDAAVLQRRLARHHVWSRTFPYDPRWIRLGLPAPDRWDQLATALAEAWA